MRSVDRPSEQLREGMAFRVLIRPTFRDMQADRGGLRERRNHRTGKAGTR